MTIELGTNERKIRSFIGWCLLGIAIGFLVITVINSQNQLLDQLMQRLPGSLNLLPTGVFDDKHVSALKQISELLPHNETVVVSDNRPVFEYFTNIEARIPSDSYSEESLVSNMRENGYKYLIVYEGNSQVHEFSELFSSDGLKRLSLYYNEIANYITVSNDIHIYQLKN